jgi:protein required for attachment to host cells
LHQVKSHANVTLFNDEERNMKKVWVVVANSSQSKIYRAENADVLVEHGLFFHDESHMQVSDLVSDKKGREQTLGLFGSDTYEAKTSVKAKEAVSFAEIIAQFLEHGYNKGECERIHIVAKPPFLGYLRQALHPNVAKIVGSEIHKDLTALRPEEIREYLPPVL